MRLMCLITVADSTVSIWVCDACLTPAYPCPPPPATPCSSIHLTSRSRRGGRWGEDAGGGGERGEGEGVTATLCTSIHVTACQLKPMSTARGKLVAQPQAVEQLSNCASRMPQAMQRCQTRRSNGACGRQPSVQMSCHSCAQKWVTEVRPLLPLVLTGKMRKWPFCFRCMQTCWA
jgi:hypothetical protein